mgnify:FL=1
MVLWIRFHEVVRVLLRKSLSDAANVFWTDCAS